MVRLRKLINYSYIRATLYEACDWSLEKVWQTKFAEVEPVLVEKLYFRNFISETCDDTLQNCLANFVSETLFAVMYHLQK